VRVVRTPAGELRLDDTGRLSGRGAYLCNDGACWRTALDKGALQRALHVPLTAELRGQLESGLTAAGMTTPSMTTTRNGGETSGEE
jgi:predicted RNA-binding protein YlxR (DUF448 family)